MSVPPPPLLPLLRSRVQGDVLAWTYLHPDAEYSLTQLAQRADASLRAVHAEVERLVAAGLLTDRRVGNVRLTRAATGTVIARPLTDLLAVTFGPLPVLADLLSGVPGIDAAYIYGSWAARYAGETGDIPNDVDVLVIGTIDLDTLDDLARIAEQTLGRPVAPTRLRRAAWAARDSVAAAEDPFLASLRSRPLAPIPLATHAPEPSR